MATKQEQNKLDLKLSFQEAICGVVKIYCPIIAIVNAVEKKKISKTSPKVTMGIKSTVLELPKAIQRPMQEVKLERFKSKTLREIVNEFVEVLQKYFPDAIDNFYRNINQADIRRRFFHTLKHDNSGYYDPRSDVDQEIQVSDYSCMFHELFHLASTIFIENGTLVGFHQEVTEKDGSQSSVGSGLNEGYTELMTRRYFGEKHAMMEAYELQVQIAESLELVVGKELMEKLFLTGNLHGLIEELKQYASEDEIRRFIFNMDISLSAKKMNKEYYEYNKYFLREINKFLLKIFYSKQNARKARGEITEAESFDEEKAFVNRLIGGVMYGKKLFTGQSDELSFARIMLGIEGEYEMKQMRDMLMNEGKGK